MGPIIKASYCLLVRRQRLDFSIGPIWTSSTCRRRQHPVSETSCFYGYCTELYVPSFQIYTTKMNTVAWVRDRTIPTDKVSVNFCGEKYHVINTTDPCGRILDSLDFSHYYFFQIAPQLYSRGWVYHVPDPLFPRKSRIAWNLTRDLWICSQELGPLNHRGGLVVNLHIA
jgi:hypothetical protein